MQQQVTEQVLARHQTCFEEGQIRQSSTDLVCMNFLLEFTAASCLYCLLQVTEYSQRKLEEMQAVHTRFKEVLQKKDNSHSCTKQQLKEATKHGKHYELLFEQQRLQLLQLSASQECESA